MQYKEYIPHSSLLGHIDAYWTLRHQQGLPLQQSILPDGCVDLILNFGTDCKTNFGKQTLHAGRSYFVGTMTSFTRTEMSEGADLLGIRFRPAAFRHFFRFDAMDQLADQTIETEQLSKAINFSAFNASSPETLLPALNQYFAGRITSLRDSLRSLTDFIIQSNGLITVQQLATQCNISVRQLERRFKQQTGIHPRQFINVIRNRAAIEAIRKRSKTTDLLDIALDYGFYDHAHLSKEIKKFAGVTPSSL